MEVDKVAMETKEVTATKVDMVAKEATEEEEEEVDMTEVAQEEDMASKDLSEEMPEEEMLEVRATTLTRTQRQCSWAGSTRTCQTER